MKKSSVRNSFRFIAVAGLLLCSTFSLFGQDEWGIGLRFGDPSGVTLKKYLTDRAFEISVGRTHWFYDDDWYGRRFDDWYERQRFGYRDLNYRGYDASAPIGLQAHYLFREGINKSTALNRTGLEWYYGFGAQLRFQSYRYDYRYKRDGGRDWYYTTSDRIVDVDIGGDVVIGLEYTFKAPISVFIDLCLFMEILDDPFLFGAQAGLGGRFNF